MADAYLGADFVPTTPILAEIEAVIERRGITVTGFGRHHMGDPRFVLDLRMGRRPRPATVAKVQAILATMETAHA